MNEQIKNIIIQCFNVNEVNSIILFGSRARGDFDKKSDYDILVILKNEIKQEDVINSKSIIRKKLADIDIAADILIKSKSVVDKDKYQIGNVVKYAMEEGIMI